MFLEPATKWQDCFKPHSGYRGSLSLWEIPLPDWKLEWHVLSKHVELVSHSFPASPSSSGQIPSHARPAVECADFPRWGDSKERGWSGDPSPRTCGDKVTFPNSSRPSGPPSSGVLSGHREVSSGTGLWRRPAGSSPATRAYSAACWSLRPPIRHSLHLPRCLGWSLCTVL